MQKVILSSLFAFVFLCQNSFGQIIPVYVTVERIGTGAAALNATATDVFLDRYDPTTAAQGTPLGTIALPTTVSGSQRRLTDSGTGTTSGYFTRFINGQGYAMAGYDAALGTAGVTGTSPATVNRIFGTVTPSFTVDTQTGYSNGGSNNFRSAATVDGSSFYGTTSSGTDGVIYLPTAGSIGSFTTIVGANSRQVRIFNNSLFYSTSSITPTVNGIFLAGTPGILPTSAVSATQLPGLGSSGIGMPTATGFYLFNNPLNANNWNTTGLDTLYVADDRSTSNGGGIQRWVFDGATWLLNGTFASPARGLTGTIDGNGLVSLWYTTTQGGSNNLNFVQDTLTAGGGAFGSATTLATASTNTVFRGVELSLVSVPEPGTMALLGLAGFFGLQWYLRKKPAVAESGKAQETTAETLVA